jgi:hypothetical protein
MIIVDLLGLFEGALDPVRVAGRRAFRKDLFTDHHDGDGYGQAIAPAREGE